MLAISKSNFIKSTYQRISEDECPQLAAALAYYTLFSLAPLLILIIAICGLVLDRETAQDYLSNRLAGEVGQDAGEVIGQMLASASYGGRGWWATGLGLITLIVAATGLLSQLQTAFNRIWDVETDSKSSGFKALIRKRLMSLALILVIAFLLLVSMLLDTVLAVMGKYIQNILQTDWSQYALQTTSLLSSLVVTTFLFAALLRFLPDAHIRWSTVAVGGLITAVLFAIGKLILAWYLSVQDLSSTYGPAGSLVGLLLWTYYTSFITLIGAELSRSWAEARGDTFAPSAGAVRSDRRERLTAQRPPAQSPPAQSPPAQSPPAQGPTAQPTA